MLFIGIVKKYSADLMLLTKLKKINGSSEKFAQNMEVQVSLTEFSLKNQGSFAGFFVSNFTFCEVLLGE